MDYDNLGCRLYNLDNNLSYLFPTTTNASRLYNLEERKEAMHGAVYMDWL